VPGTITSAISIHKVGTNTVNRILRVEGMSGGRTGYWERDVAAPRAAGWTFHPTDLPLGRVRLDNPRRDTSSRGLGPGEDQLYRLRSEEMAADLVDFNVYCSPARLRLDEGGRVRELRLHHVDGLRQQVRGRGLDHVPRAQYGALEYPDGSFREVTVRATRSEIVIEELGWRFERAASEPCLPRRARISRLGVGGVRLGLTRRRLLSRLPAPRTRTARSWRWCVVGGGRVVAAFARGRVLLVRTNARGHRRGRMRPGARAIGRRTVRAGARTVLVLGVRRGRIRYVTVRRAAGRGRGAAATPRDSAMPANGR
jgi:hypothetical protein